MRTLDSAEIEQVAGGDWSLGFDLKVVHGEISGDEDIQDMAGATATIATDAYWGARDAMADFYEWAAAGWQYSATCGM